MTAVAYWHVTVQACSSRGEKVSQDVLDRIFMAQAPDRLAAYGVKERLRARWVEAHAGERGGAQFPALRDGDFAGARQRVLFAVLNSYRDVLLPAYPYPTKCARSRKADQTLIERHMRSFERCVTIHRHLALKPRDRPDACTRGLTRPEKPFKRAT